LRKEKNLTQKEASVIAGILPKTISSLKMVVLPITLEN